MKKLYLFLLTVVVSVVSFSQASLPLSRTAWNTASAEPTGWTQTGCANRTTTFACSGSDARTFDGTGDVTTVTFTGTPGDLTFKLKKASMSGASQMTVEQLISGSWTLIGNYGTASGATAITDCGDITVTLNSLANAVRWTYTKGTGNCDLDDVSILVGTPSCTPPSAQASFTSFSSVAATSFDINFGAGTGGIGRMVVVKEGSAISGAPINGTSYTTGISSDFSASTSNIAAGEVVVYDGVGTSVNVTGLNPNTTYYVAIFEYNTGDCYNTTMTGNTGSTTTLCNDPTIAASSPSSSAIDASTATLSWTNGDGSNRLLVLKESSAVTSAPADGTDYSSGLSANFSTTTSTLSATEKNVYNGTGSSIALSGLTSGTTYYYAIYEFNAAANCYMTTATSGSFTTLNIPVVQFTTSADNVGEGAGTYNVQVEMLSAPPSTVVMQVAVLGGTATGGGVDYTYSTSTINFLTTDVYPITKSVSVTIVDDASSEPTESISFDLSKSSGPTVSIASSVMTLNIVDNEVATGLVLNEFSQGASGSKEYVEVVVVGAPGTTVDIRGWSFDDNNGNLSAGAGINMGIASGHIRLADNCTWEQVPAGSVIVFYNAADPETSIPAPDPTDANNDYVYIVPIDGSASCPSSPVSVYFQGKCNNPNASDPSYASGTLTDQPNWLTIGFANSGDGVQMLDPSLNFYQGISYGSGSDPACSPCALIQSNHPEYTSYGADCLYFTESGSNRNYYFGNTVDDDYRSKANWGTGTGTATRTPGAGNNAANTAWINSMRSNFNVVNVDADRTCELRPFQTRVFLADQIGTETVKDQIIVKVVNNVATDHGSTTAKVDFGGGNVLNAALSPEVYFMDPVWELTPTATTGADYTITFYANDASINSLVSDYNTHYSTSLSLADAKALMMVYKLTGGDLSSNPKNAASMTGISSTSPTLGTYTTYNTFAANFTSFSSYALGLTPPTPLPVEWLSFTARVENNNDVLVNWVTATEINCDYFDMERSVNGNAFEKVGTLKGAGNSTVTQTYTFTDAKLAPSVYYYRIKQVDFNGDSEYSKVVAVQVQTTEPAVNVHPNPLQNILTVKLDALTAENVQVSLVDALGRVVLAEKYQLEQGENQLFIDTENLDNGVYFLRVDAGNWSKSVLLNK